MITSRKKGGDYQPLSTVDQEAAELDAAPTNNRRVSTDQSTLFPCRERGAPDILRGCTCLTFVVLSLWIFIALINLGRDVVPEVDLVIASKCARPMQNWDGRLFNYPIWHNYYSDRPPYYNLHTEFSYVGDDNNHQVALRDGAGDKRPVIIFGTHHKTGTFLAKKLFARLCSKMNWCCLFHVTRDSIHAVTAGLQNEPVNALGHNQWIWNPNTLGIREYRFIHFYRHPYKKIISGYRYHADGTEEWTQKPLTYDHLCSTPLLKSSTPLSSTVVTGTGSPPPPQSDAGIVWDYCEGVHLCETCCRMEHEKMVVNPKGEKSLKLVRRSKQEYQFMCDKLGRGAEIMNKALAEHLKQPSKLKRFHHTATPSIQEMLLHSPPAEGILTEAALDYYENLRMATIINETAHDPRTLNVDIDDLNSNFADVTLRMLRHLEGIIPSRRIKELHEDLAFYDLQTSPVYRWSMSNPIINHITGTASGSPPLPAPSSPGASGGVLTTASTHLKGSVPSNATAVPAAVDAPLTVATASSTFLMTTLRSDPSVTRMYAPILKLMESVLTKKTK